MDRSAINTATDALITITLAHKLSPGSLGRMITNSSGRFNSTQPSSDAISDDFPLVTVIALCYNQRRFVIETLDSIRNQTYSNIQLIITDDCSTDDSVALIQDWLTTYNVESVFIRNDRNKGICKTLNHALCFAKGKYVSIVAADDVFLNNRIEGQVQRMEGLSEDFGVLFNDALQIDEDGNPLPKTYYEMFSELKEVPQGDIFAKLVDWNFVFGAAFVRKLCYDKVGHYDEKLCYEDWDMWLRIAQHYKFAYSQTPSIKYRIVPTSVTRTLLGRDSSRALISNFRIFEKALKEYCQRHGYSPDPIALNLRQQLVTIAESLYHSDANSSSYHLMKAFRYHPNSWTLRLLIFSMFGIRYARAAKLNSLLAHYKHILKR